MIFSLFLSDQPFNLLALFVVCYVRKQLSKAFQVLPMDGVPHDGLHAPFDGENEVRIAILFDCCKPVQAHLGDPKKAAELQGLKHGGQFGMQLSCPDQNTQACSNADISIPVPTRLRCGFLIFPPAMLRSVSRPETVRTRASAWPQLRDRLRSASRGRPGAQGR